MSADMSPYCWAHDEWLIMKLCISPQGSKFVVANATMFCHLLPGCSSGSKHVLLPYILDVLLI